MKIREVLNQDNWPIQRYAILEEVEMDNGKIRYHIQIGDNIPGRKPFIDKWFNDIVPARDFYDRVKNTETGS